MRITNTKLQSNMAGISLVETMICLVIGLFILSLTVNTFVAINKQHFLTQQQSQLQQNLRFANHVLKSNLQKIQYWHGLIPFIDMSGSLAGDINLQMDCDRGQIDWSIRATHTIRVSNNTLGNYRCINSSTFKGSDVLTLRYLQEEAVKPDSHYPYIRLSRNQAKIFHYQDSDTAENQFPVNDVRSYQLVTQSFYIAKTSRYCNGKSIPALYRQTVVNGLPRTEELISGIEQLEIELITRTPEISNSWQVVNAELVANWQHVVGVNIMLIARSDCEVSNIAKDRRIEGVASFYYQDGYLRETSFLSVDLSSS
ncbi:PilW family protein [Thalassotalea sp. PS06]|uniref:PilW family protein n=1 Tax=Thalassotalea sp. PS06 TaxID=2594005 RepID=UPI001163EC66|nr:PilW family protein [Thalassotalea sp. PS06]QDP02041.1 hypothetical protein FNC98_12255 [Thalassotalea sp. PS06]